MRVAVHDRHVLVEVEHDAVHPARDERSRRLSRGSAARSVGPGERAHDLDRHGRDVVVRGHRLRPRPSRRVIRPPRDLDALDRRVAADLDAQRPRGAPPTGRSRRREVGPSSTRSARPPARVRSKSSCSRIVPPVRALISRARAATSVRVSPSARNLRNAGERWSAPTKDHQLWSSHWPRRRSSQLVSSVSSRSRKNAGLVRRDAEARRGLEHEARDEREVLERLRQVGGA